MALEQYSPFLGTEFLQYPIVDEYDIPDVQIMSDDPLEGGEDELDDRSRATDEAGGWRAFNSNQHGELE